MAGARYHALNGTVTPPYCSAESRKPKAESRKPRAESREPKPRPTWPLLAVVAGVLGITVAAAVVVPMRRAIALDPSRALRGN
jgi:hypothetical protein